MENRIIRMHAGLWVLMSTAVQPGGTLSLEIALRDSHLRPA
jgi:hypothetical protein